MTSHVSAPADTVAARNDAEESTNPFQDALKGSGGSTSSLSVISDNQLREYHRVLSLLSSIRCMPEAVSHPSGLLMWDYAKNQCRPGRQWYPTAPEHIAAALRRDFTVSEIEAARKAAKLPVFPLPPGSASSGGAGSAGGGGPFPQPQAHPTAVLVLGPIASGKSHMRRKAAKLLHINLADFVEIDANEIRNAHAGWAAAVDDPTAGYMDAWSLIKPQVYKLQRSFMRTALRMRLNVIVPWTASVRAKTLRHYSELVSAGYRVDVVGLVVSYQTAVQRMQNRAHLTGRYASLSLVKWDEGLQAISYVASPDVSSSAVVLDNTNFQAPRLLYSRTLTMAKVVNIINAHRAAAGFPPEAFDTVFAEADDGPKTDDRRPKAKTGEGPKAETVPKA
eukprot:TRINITY_DN71241_c0_g1_i1.p1 TRINITY_DN71241_c0_g1~~TRINITY_DN71241_c0_g1_i1.p1  ORF type:complete len:392 (-),score=83.81 TRINITY_DN71241_c0_g1_i1:231-1406(-)